jgi:CLIP-associating protein 1/2
MFEPIFSGLLKLASLTKKSVASASQDAVALMLRRCTYHPKILPLLASTLDQKSIQARTYAARHLKDFVEVQCPAYKDAVEGTPAAGLPLLTSMVKKELADPSTAVRDYGRATYWLVDGLWPDSGQAILQTLDSAARKGLERNGSRHAAGIFHAESLAASSSSKPTPGRPSMRELISSRRAAQVAATPRTTRLANPASTMPESTAPTSTISATEANSQNSPASPSQKPRLSADNEATPVKMGAVTSSGPSVSHIPSPTRRTQHSPRSRVSSGNASKASFGGGENALRHSSAAVEEQPDPTAATSMRKAMKVLPGGSLFTSSDSRLSQKHQPRRSRSSSPELSLPKGVADYSDIEASTFNAMPDGLDSTDDESLNIINYNPPTQDMRVAIDVDTSEQSRILDSLMDTTISLNDNAEIEEAVKGRAEQAEQAAHRFLELAESDYDEQNVSAADTTVLAQHEATSSDIPVPYTPNGKLVNHPGLPEASSYASQFEKKDSVASDATPLLLRLQALQLQDSPAGKAAPSALLQRVSIQDHWWMAKADCK